MQANQTYSSMSVVAGARFGHSGAKGKSQAQYAPETETHFPSGWWLLPSVIGGAGFWVWAAVSLFT